MMSIIIELAATAIDVVFLCWFITHFLNVSLIQKPHSIIWLFALFIYQTIIDHLLHVFDMVGLIGSLAISICFALSLQKKKYIWPIFSALLYLIVIMLSNSLVYSVFSLFIDNIDVSIYGTKSYVRFIYLLVAKLVQLTFYRLLLLLFKKEDRLDLKNGILSFAFTVATAFALGLLMKIISLSPDGKSDSQIFILALILILLNIILYLMIYQVQNLMKNKYELLLLQDRIDFEKSRVEEAATIWQNIRKTKHDIQNHFSVLSGHLKRGDTKACEDYIEKLHNTINNMGTLIQSGNSVIDYLINSKLTNLNDVEVLVSGYVGDYSDIDDVDLACILGNILDNAIEAQNNIGDGRRIELLFFNKKFSRIIICKNSITKSVLSNNPELKSTKNLPDMHGIGHQVVETTVKKYDGIVEYFENDGMFGVQILFPI